MPKPRPNGVGEGQQVNIPAPVRVRLYDGVTQKDRRSARLEMRGGDGGGPFRQIRRAVNAEGSHRGSFGGSEVADFTLPGKTSKEFLRCPYRKPTQVDRERIPRRVRERSLRNSAN